MTFQAVPLPVLQKDRAVQDKEELLEPDHCARMLRAMGDPERLRIVQCLRTGPRNVSEIAEHLEEDLVKISHHLGVLRQAGIVLDSKQGRFVIYRLNPEVFHPTPPKSANDHLDFGCCRIELPKR
jgi:ArsR family transcriptional regulator